MVKITGINAIKYVMTAKATIARYSKAKGEKLDALNIGDLFN